MPDSLLVLRDVLTPAARSMPDVGLLEPASDPLRESKAMMPDPQP